MAVMHSDDDGTHVLTSPMVSIGDDAQLSFWLLHMDEYNSFSVLISDDCGHSWSTLKDIANTAKGLERDSHTFEGLFRKDCRHRLPGHRGGVQQTDLRG